MMLSQLVKVYVAVLCLMSVVFGGEAQAKFVFNYNHPDLEWYTIETDHYMVHYPVSKKGKSEGNPHALTAEWSARKMAKVAEEIWPKMCAEFNYFLNEKVHVVVLNQGDQLEGFTIPSWDWVEISANPGGIFYRGRGRMEWFSDVFVHEFAHVVSLKANAAMAEGVQGVMLSGLYQNGINVDGTGQRSVAAGAKVVFGDSESVFWTEGGAEYWSDNTGYNWWTTSRDQNIRMSVLQDRLLTYDEWHTRFGKWGWGDSERYYQQGYNFGLYLRQRFGDDTYARFAIEHGRRWRFEWVNVVEAVLGISARDLYDDWVEYITDRYESQYAQIKVEGEVVGQELSSGPAEWDFKDPGDRDKFHGLPKWQQERARESSGKYKFEPRTSGDGRWWGYLNYASVYVHDGADENFWNFTGVAPSDPARLDQLSWKNTNFSADFEHGWDFVPGKDALVLTGREDQNRQDHLSRFGLGPEVDGYNWKDLWVFEFPQREDRVGNRTVKTIAPKKPMKWLKPATANSIYADGTFRKIPNTARGVDPAVSPDGKTVAFFEYTDGTLNLATVQMDGSGKRYLTQYKDGTWLQVVDWSPDGQQLVLAIFRNYQQNLYLMNKDGTKLRPIMVDAWEELDAHWSAVDGKIYFSADPTGVFNIFSYDPKTGEFLQITNVVGGAQSPQLTRNGNLIYSYYTAFGWKVMGLAKDEFLNKAVDDLFDTDFDMDQVRDGLSFEEDLTYFAEMTSPYKAHKAMMSPSGVPMFELQSSGRSEIGLSGGGQIYAQDYVENHVAVGTAMLGEDSYVLGQYYYQGWYPTLSLGAFHYRAKNVRGFLIDEDDNPATTGDQSVFEVKSAMQQNQIYGSSYIQWNDNVIFGLSGEWMNYRVKGTTDSTWEPYMHSYSTRAFFNFENAKGANGPNPSSGRSIGLDLTHGWTNITYPTFGGVAIDDGEVLDAYQYNKIEWRWTELLRVPDFGLPFLSKEKGVGSHTLQFDMQLGVLDRNVDVNDEFRAGGRHPADVGYSSVQPNTQFAGYPGWSLSGETMAIFNVAYRFPLNRYSYTRWGPMTAQGVWMQFGGSAGNLWSYRPPEDPSASYRSQYDDRIAYNPGDIRREIPFKDVAYKNGNRMLYDAFAEVRIASVFREGMYWNSFLRFAYGFNDIRGYDDVDGDGIFDTSETGVGDELSAEVEPAGWRFYLGLGTGW